MLDFLKKVVANLPADWLNLTTHRLDIYNENLAKTEFNDRFEDLFVKQVSDNRSLAELPTAFDYIRLGHPLSCVLEWGVAKLQFLNHTSVIAFSSQVAPILAVLRSNLINNKQTLIAYKNELPEMFDADLLMNIYGYNFELKRVKDASEISGFEGSVIWVDKRADLWDFEAGTFADFQINYNVLGSIVLIHGSKNASYISEIQHYRRRETIAITPANALKVLKQMLGETVVVDSPDAEMHQDKVVEIIKDITSSPARALVGSSGLSVQYAIVMGLIHSAIEQYPNKKIKVVVPPNCYGGTNDQARRIATCLSNVEVLDLPVDGNHNMVDCLDVLLDQVAEVDAVPFIIAEIPTNPRVEVPDLKRLSEVLSRVRVNGVGKSAVEPVFILDQTFCPNVKFLSGNSPLADVQVIAYVSGSKFPSGGECTAGYCVANEKAAYLMGKIKCHLQLCDNEARSLQWEILGRRLPSMLERIELAFENTMDFVAHIRNIMPDAKINFVSDELIKQGFKPSVFSLDLPTIGGSHQEREMFKRKQNLKLIGEMIGEIPESKFCVSYGQLKGCYWTIPATSTQGTTKEGDKDYIVRVALSPQLDLEKHKEVFSRFAKSMAILVG